MAATVMVLVGLVLWSSRAAVAATTAATDTAPETTPALSSAVAPRGRTCDGDDEEADRESSSSSSSSSSPPSERAATTVSTTTDDNETTSDSITTPFLVHMILPFDRSTIWYRRKGPERPAYAASTPEPRSTAAPDQARSVIVVTPDVCDDGAGRGVTSDGRTVKVPCRRRRRKRRRKMTTTDGRRRTNTMVPLPGFPPAAWEHDDDDDDDDDPAAGATTPRHAFRVPADQLRLLYTVRHVATNATVPGGSTTNPEHDEEEEAEEIIHV